LGPGRPVAPAPKKFGRGKNKNPLEAVAARGFIETETDWLSDHFNPSRARAADESDTDDVDSSVEKSAAMRLNVNICEYE
jgi:hypothetical protein